MVRKARYKEVSPKKLIRMVQHPPFSIESEITQQECSLFETQHEKKIFYRCVFLINQFKNLA